MREIVDRDTPAAMTGRHRLMAAMRGETVDRPPIWLREGFPLITGPAEAGDFHRGWQADPVYRELFDYVAPHAAAIENWGCPSLNRYLMVPPDALASRTLEQTPERRRSLVTIATPRGELTELCEHRRGMANLGGWKLKRPVEGREDLLKLASVPFEVRPEDVERGLESYRAARRRTGQRGVLRLNLPSPMIAVSHVMSLEDFLAFSVTDGVLFHEQLEEITARVLAVLEALWAEGDLDTTVNLGGSEQCTPPMMRPEAFDEFVVPYDGPIIAWLHRRGVPVNMHCHGKVRHALECMVRMGVDATDPVEPPPAGDVTYAEARAVAGDDLTLVGNLEFDELEYAEPEAIRRRVAGILSHGRRRLILAASAGPISPVSPRLADNYRAWIDAALELTEAAQR